MPAISRSVFHCSTLDTTNQHDHEWDSNKCLRRLRQCLWSLQPHNMLSQKLKRAGETRTGNRRDFSWYWSGETRLGMCVTPIHFHSVLWALRAYNWGSRALTGEARTCDSHGPETKYSATTYSLKCSVSGHLIGSVSDSSL